MLTFGTLPPDSEHLIPFPDNTRRHQESQHVHRTSDTQTASIQDMRVDHRRSHILVSEELLHNTDVVSIFEKMDLQKFLRIVRYLLDGGRF